MASRQERRRTARLNSADAIARRPLSRADEEGGNINRDLAAAREELERVPSLCAACGALASEKKLLHCRACGFDRYCDRDCQRAAWARHKLVCRVMAADKEVAAGFTGFRLGEQLAGVDQTLAWLGSGKATEVAKACSTLQVLFHRVNEDVDFDSIAFDLAGRGRALPLLVDSLSIGGYVAVRALDVLSALSAVDAEAVKVVAGGALPHIMWLMELPFQLEGDNRLKSVRVATFAAACTLSRLSSVSALRPAIVEAGAAPRLASLLAMARDPHWLNPGEFASKHMRLVTAIHNLALCEQQGAAAVPAARAFISAGVVPHLLTALGGEEAGSGMAAAALGALLDFDEFKTIGVDATLLPRTAALIERGGETIHVRRL